MKQLKCNSVQKLKCNSVQKLPDKLLLEWNKLDSILMPRRAPSLISPVRLRLARLILVTSPPDSRKNGNPKQDYDKTNPNMLDERRVTCLISHNNIYRTSPHKSHQIHIPLLEVTIKLLFSTYPSADKKQKMNSNKKNVTLELCT